jgi:hypothetical protein
MFSVKLKNNSYLLSNSGVGGGGSSSRSSLVVDLDGYEDAIECAQKYALCLNASVMKLNHKTSKVRDSGDEIARLLTDFSDKNNTHGMNSIISSSCRPETSTANELLNKNLKQFASYLSLVEDHRDSMVFGEGEWMGIFID